MNGALQARIRPHVSPRSMDFSSEKVKSPNSAAEDSTRQHKTSFKDLLLNSNAEVQRRRAAQKNGDFSSAKSEEEFFQMLRDKANAKVQKAPSKQLDKDAFMKLFVTQLQYQDPLKPDDSAQMAAQLAQFNGLEQMMNVNKNLEKMSKDQGLSRAVGLVDFVGKEVRLNGGKMRFANGKLTDATFSVERDVPNAILEVRDSAGVTVGTKDLGNIPRGEHQVEWDGLGSDGQKVRDGVYTFAVVAKGMNGEDVPSTITSTVKVTGIDLQDDGGAFYTEVGKIDVSDVAAVGNLGFQKASKEADAPVAGESVKPSVSPAPRKSDASSQVLGSAASTGEKGFSERARADAPVSKVPASAENG